MIEPREDFPVVGEELSEVGDVEMKVDMVEETLGEEKGVEVEIEEEEEAPVDDPAEVKLEKEAERADMVFRASNGDQERGRALEVDADVGKGSGDEGALALGAAELKKDGAASGDSGEVCEEGKVKEEGDGGEAPPSGLDRGGVELRGLGELDLEEVRLDDFILCASIPQQLLQEHQAPAPGTQRHSRLETEDDICYNISD